MAQTFLDGYRHAYARLNRYKGILGLICQAKEFERMHDIAFENVPFEYIQGYVEGVHQWFVGKVGDHDVDFELE